MKILRLLSFFFVINIFVLANAQKYCEPSGVVPSNIEHVNSQSFYSINVKSGETILLSYVDVDAPESYNWLQETQKFSAKRGQELIIDVRTGIWSWNIVLGFDWDGNGSFEDTYWAFGDKTQPISTSNSSWSTPPYDVADWRRAEEKNVGHRGVVQHTFNITVPADANLADSRMRVLCDGDGYNNGGVPPLNLCQSIGYAGTIHDFGLSVTGEPVATPVITPNGGRFMNSQKITIATLTEGASIYYTLDESTPSASSTLYTGPITLTATTTVKAIAIKDGLADSEVVNAMFILDGKTITPKSSPPEGTYNGIQQVSLSTDTPGAIIYYTLDGTTPLTSSTQYVSPIEISETTTLKAIATKTGETKSDIFTAVYTLTWVEPGGLVHQSEERYITSATTTDAKVNLGFSQSVNPNTPYIHSKNPIETEQGATFTLNLLTTDQMKWCRAAIYADWNRDYQFNETDELIARIGKENQRNDEVLNITQAIAIPQSAATGITRLRVQYTDAWTKNDRPSFNYTANEDIYKGGIYDFDLKIDLANAISSQVADVSLFYMNSSSNTLHFVNTDNACIYNTNGVLLFSKDVAENPVITISLLPKGVYIVKMEKANIVSTQKLVKN